MWAAGAWTREAISLFRDILSTSGMPGAGLGAVNPGERGIGLSGRAPQLAVAGLPLEASFLSNNFAEHAR